MVQRKYRKATITWRDPLRISARRIHEVQRSATAPLHKRAGRPSCLRPPLSLTPPQPKQRGLYTWPRKCGTHPKAMSQTPPWMVYMCGRAVSPDRGLGEGSRAHCIARWVHGRWGLQSRIFSRAGDTKSAHRGRRQKYFSRCDSEGSATQGIAGHKNQPVRPSGLHRTASVISDNLHVRATPLDTLSPIPKDTSEHLIPKVDDPAPNMYFQS